MPSILIAGASRGIGLALVEVYLERGDEVHAVVRSHNAALQHLQAQHPQRLHLITCDLTDAAAIPTLCNAITRPLDTLVFNAGISGPQSIDEATPAQIADLFLTNAIAPVRIARALNQHLQVRSAIAFMSSRMGSVELAMSADMPLYGASKAALNILLRSWSAAQDKPAACLLALHPGWVQTDMGGDAAPLQPRESAAGLVAVLDRYAGVSGCHFVDYQQDILPW